MYTAEFCFCEVVPRLTFQKFFNTCLPWVQMPGTIEELEAAIQDTVSQANSILFLNHNILEEYESRQRKVNSAMFYFSYSIFWWMNDDVSFIQHFVALQIESLKSKQDSVEQELSRCVDEINSLKVEKFSCFSYTNMTCLHIFCSH